MKQLRRPATTLRHADNHQAGSHAPGTRSASRDTSEDQRNGDQHNGDQRNRDQRNRDQRNGDQRNEKRWSHPALEALGVVGDVAYLIFIAVRGVLRVFF